MNLEFNLFQLILISVCCLSYDMPLPSLYAIFSSFITFVLCVLCIFLEKIIWSILGLTNGIYFFVYQSNPVVDLSGGRVQNWSGSMEGVPHTYRTSFKGYLRYKKLFSIIVTIPCQSYFSYQYFLTLLSKIPQ